MSSWRPLLVSVTTLALLGDVNNDGVVNVIDAQQIMRFSIGMSVDNPSALTERGDVNGDGKVDVIDAQRVLRMSVELPLAR